MTEPSSQPPPAPPAPGLWPRMKGHILQPEMTPERVALSFALGFSIAWNPVIGVHTWLVLMLCILFRRLHRPLMFVAAFINNPWTMVPIATLSALAGNALLGRGWHLSLEGIQWRSLGWRSFATREGFEAMLDMLRPILTPYLLGGFVLSALALPLGYFAMLHLARRLRRLHIPLPPAPRQP